MSLTNIMNMLTGGSNAVENISAPSAIQFHGDKDTIFVDVRSHGEVQMSGTIKGALVVPLNELNMHAKPDGSGKFPAANENKRIILVCASGARSGSAARQLAGMGYENAANLSGGIGAWHRAGGAMGR
ncbi:MAG: rhodanese-like domain-containing protein [Devosiaceae bacterium]|nr:rhodanese-like domain-containing protein [Devosiaceae bacterium]